MINLSRPYFLTNNAIQSSASKYSCLTINFAPANSNNFSRQTKSNIGLTLNVLLFGLGFLLYDYKFFFYIDILIIFMINFLNIFKYFYNCILFFNISKIYLYDKILMTKEKDDYNEEINTENFIKTSDFNDINELKDFINSLI